MKKYLLFACFLGLAATMAYSQSLTLSNEFGPVANNATIVVTGLPSDDEIVVEMNITNTTSDSIPVICKKVETSLVPGTATLFCWGLCFSPTVYVSPDPLYIHAGETNTADFSGHYLPQGFSGLSTVRYVFYDERNPDDSVCFNADFQAYPLGVGEPVANGTISAYPNPASGNVTFTFSANDAVNGKIVIRNLVGETVRELNLSGTAGQVSFNVAELASGIYFYSLVSGGQTAATKKLVVRTR